jgi:hypothetical protein
LPVLFVGCVVKPAGSFKGVLFQRKKLELIGGSFNSDETFDFDFDFENWRFLDCDKFLDCGKY